MCLNGCRVVHHHRSYCQDEGKSGDRQTLQNRAFYLLRGVAGFVELQGFAVVRKSVCFHGIQFSRWWPCRLIKGNPHSVNFSVSAAKMVTDSH